MKKKKRRFCPYCSDKIIYKNEDDVLREHCPSCNIFFYDNPLPVVSSVLEKDRKILLVKRGNKPYKGMWCLPSGFAETGETIEAATLRELREETGIKAKITSLIDADSCTNYLYGDLIFLSFEVEQTGGKLEAGDDAIATKYFPIDKIPKLAFSSNTKAVEAYIKSKKDYWAILDSFNLSLSKDKFKKKEINLLSNKLIEMIEKNTKSIAELWLLDISSNKSTPHYHLFDKQKLLERSQIVISQLSKWLSMDYNKHDIRNFYKQLGNERRKEDFALSEVISSLSLIRKHIWEFALSRGIWNTTIDIYIALELGRRMMLFFDKATYYVSIGYETEYLEK
ncbi:MAG: NUDIX domain-containing protein [Bacteroidales bacterium]|nr:NUDIX domain-containing protein [Bacteroidales bacterium]